MAFAVIYALSVQYNWALFTYFPILEQIRPGAPSATRDTGPAMYWYGWLVTSALGSIAVCLVALILPFKGDKLWPTLCWAVPSLPWPGPLGSLPRSGFFSIVVAYRDGG